MNETTCADNKVDSVKSETESIQSPVPEVQTEHEAISKKPRNYSFLGKKTESMDEVQVGNSTFPIPANPGSTYWAILKVCYQFADQPIFFKQLTDGVNELMIDRDEDWWKTYCSKKTTTTVKAGQRVVKEIKHWHTRIVNNAKTLTRLGGDNKYGLRLHERGHQLFFRYDEKTQQPYFILITKPE